MPDEVLKAVVFCHRIDDDQDFTEKIICIPPSQAEYLREELKKREAEGKIDMVQMGQVYVQATVRTPYEDECDQFLAKIDEIVAA